MPDALHLTAPPGALIAQMSRIAPTGDTDGRARKFNRGGNGYEARSHLDRQETAPRCPGRARAAAPAGAARVRPGLSSRATGRARARREEPLHRPRQVGGLDELAVSDIEQSLRRNPQAVRAGHRTEPGHQQDQPAGADHQAQLHEAVESRAGHSIPDGDPLESHQGLLGDSDRPNPDTGERHRRYDGHAPALGVEPREASLDRKSTRLNSSHRTISYAVF